MTLNLKHVKVVSAEKSQNSGVAAVGISVLSLQTRTQFPNQIQRIETTDITGMLCSLAIEATCVKTRIIAVLSQESLVGSPPQNALIRWRSHRDTVTSDPLVGDGIGVLTVP